MHVGISGRPSALILAVFLGMKMDDINMLDFRPNNHQKWTLFQSGSPLSISYQGLHFQKVVLTKGTEYKPNFEIESNDTNSLNTGP